MVISFPICPRGFGGCLPLFITLLSGGTIAFHKPPTRFQFPVNLVSSTYLSMSYGSADFLTSSLERLEARKERRGCTPFKLALTSLELKKCGLNPEIDAPNRRVFFFTTPCAIRPPGGLLKSKNQPLSSLILVMIQEEKNETLI